MKTIRQENFAVTIEIQFLTESKIVGVRRKQMERQLNSSKFPKSERNDSTWIVMARRFKLNHEILNHKSINIDLGTLKHVTNDRTLLMNVESMEAVRIKI